MNKYYIISKRRAHKKDFAILFWGPNRTGYRYNVNDVGIYTEEEAKTFDEDHYSDDMPVLKEIVDDLLVNMVIDNTKLGKVCINNAKNRKILGVKLNELQSGDTSWDKGAFCEPERFLQLNQNTINIINEIQGINK